MYSLRFRSGLWWGLVVFTVVDLVTPFLPMLDLILLGALFSPQIAGIVRDFVGRGVPD